jgi:hypothetical protein
VLGLGIVMSACRYSELDESGVPRWFNLVVCTGALAINVAVSVACICQGGQNWRPANVAGLAPMVIVSAALSVLAGRQARRDPL